MYVRDLPVGQHLEDEFDKFISCFSTVPWTLQTWGDKDIYKIISLHA